MSSLIETLQPQDIQLKIRILAACFENPFLDSDDEALELRFGSDPGDLTRAVQDLELCGVLGPVEQGRPFCQEPGAMARAAEAAAAARSEETRTRSELSELAEAGKLLDRLSVEREEVARILEMVPGGVLLVDRFGCLLKGNAAGRRLAQLPPDGLRDPVCRRLGLDPEELVVRDVHRELDLATPVSVSSRPFRLPDGASGAVITLQDISERRELESRVEQTREAFFSMIRHELRRPLQVLERALSPATLPPQAASSASLVEAVDATAQLGRMVDDMLLLARLEKDPVSACTFGPVSLSYLLSAGDLAFRERALDSGIRLTMVPPDEDVVFQGDRGRLTQVVSNLVENALRFTPPGGDVTLAGGRQSGVVALAVSDTGPGIPESELERVFDRFHQSVDGVTRPEGLGLGLAICRLLVRAHGGTIRARNRDPNGAEFLVQLPREGPDARPAAGRAEGGEYG